MKKMIINFIYYIVYIISLILCYSTYIVKKYGYYGFKNEPTLTSIIIGIIILTIAYWYVYKQKTNTYSKFITYALFLVNFIPGIITFIFMPFNYNYLIFFILYWLLLILFINFLNKFRISNKRKRFKGNVIVIYVLLLFQILVTLFIIGKYVGINLKFSNVYELRDNFKLSKMPTILYYLFSNFKVINPILFIFFYNNKNKIGKNLSFILQVLMFLADGSKATLFSIIIAYFIAKFSKKKIVGDFLKNDKFKFYILYLLVVLNVVGFLESLVNEKAYIYNYFIRRLFFLPSLLNHYYYDFFTVNPIDKFKQSILGRLGYKSFYGRSTQNIIGEVYFNSPDMIANNGLFSDAYMNLGKLGVVIMPILISAALRFLDFCANDIKSTYLITLLITISYVFLSSSFFTVLLTHGFLSTCILLLIFLPKEKKGEKLET